MIAVAVELYPRFRQRGGRSGIGRGKKANGPGPDATAVVAFVFLSIVAGVVADADVGFDLGHEAVLFEFFLVQDGRLMVVVAVHRGGVVFSSFTARVVVITKSVAGMDRHSETKLIEQQQDER